MIGNEQQMYQYLLLERSIFNQVMKLEWGVFPLSTEIGIIVTYFCWNIAKTEGGEKGSEKHLYIIVGETNINKCVYTHAHTLPYLS